MAEGVGPETLFRLVERQACLASERFPVRGQEHRIPHVRRNRLGVLVKASISESLPMGASEASDFCDEDINTA